MYWLRRLFRKQQTERQLDSELGFHLEQRAAELAEAGIAPEEARRRARIEFGGVEGIKEECRESRRVHLLETFLQDVRYGLRTMRRSPGVSAVASLTLALGIGANTAVFSVINAVLLDPLPYKNPDQLMIIRQNDGASVTYPNFLDFKKYNHSFELLALFRSESFNRTGGTTPERVRGWMVSSEIFSLLGAQPLKGRLLRPEDDRLSAPPVVVLSEAMWRQEFASDPNVTGKNITLSGNDYTIIGVTPAWFPFFRGRTLFLPIGQWSEPAFRARHGGMGTTAVGRLRPGLTAGQGRADLNQVAQQLAQAYPEDDSGLKIHMVSLRTAVVGAIQPTLLMLFAAVGFVLLIACANVANLLLAKATSRSREVAIRLALGGRRSRLIRQLLTETMLLALCGGLLGTALASWGTSVMIKVAPYSLSGQSIRQLDPGVLLFTVLTCLLTGLLFGLAPALISSRVNVQQTLKEGGRGATRGHQRTQKTLVAAEVAVAMVLLAGAGLLIQSLRHVLSVKPGFNPTDLLTFNLGLSMESAKTPARVRLALDKLTGEVESLPGVESAALLFGDLPLTGESDVSLYRMDRPRPGTQGQMSGAIWYATGPDYLKAMGIRLIQGRFFNAQDTAGSPQVAVIDETLARDLFPEEDPLGKQVHLEFFDQAVEIVGVAGNVKHMGLDSAPGADLLKQIYIPYAQVPDRLVPLLSRYVSGVVRTTKRPDSLIAPIQQRLLVVDDQQVMYAPQTMDALIRESLSNRRFAMLLLGLFAVVALGLASVGIYGVISYVVGQRTHEIGVRMALGAQRDDVLRMVLAGGMLPVLFGLGAGLALVWPLASLLSSMLFGVKPRDPATLAAVEGLLMAVGLMACWVPARRATRVDPTVALRYE